MNQNKNQTDTRDLRRYTMAQNEIELAFIEAVLDKYVEPVFSKVARTLKNQWEKVKIDLDLSFRNYLKNALEKYSKIKTILYRTEPKHIYDFFECPFLIKLKNMMALMYITC